MSRDVVVTGVGMHPWGKWGRNFVEYGVAAARDALEDSGVAWDDIGFVAGVKAFTAAVLGGMAGHPTRVAQIAWRPSWRSSAADSRAEEKEELAAEIDAIAGLADTDPGTAPA